jgi:hypothetical protein
MLAIGMDQLSPDEGRLRARRRSHVRIDHDRRILFILLFSSAPRI